MKNIISVFFCANIFPFLNTKQRIINKKLYLCADFSGMFPAINI